MAFLRRLLIAVGVFVALLGLLWGTLALWIDGPSSPWLAGSLAGGYALIGLYMLWQLRTAASAGLALLLWLGIAATWEQTIPPRNDRQWMPDVENLPTATLDGDRLTVRNVRDFDYHASDADFTPRWETRTYDLTQLRGGDIFFSFWGPTDIAHTIASWDFGDDRHLAISIETRKEVGESYSAVRGFFRQYELYYVVADERDVIGVRANQRGEHVFLHALLLPPDVARALLLEYVGAVNRLAVQPSWYNALTQNCTTSIRKHAARVMPLQPWSWQLLLNGHLEEMWYRNGVFHTALPFSEFKQRSEVTERAKAAEDAPDFSSRIRQGLPEPPAR
ncbi:MAG: DUF4105 domain-containing protein [bacterium]